MKRRCGRRAAHAVPLHRVVLEDLQTVIDRDPSRRSRAEALLHAPWRGLVLYRLAHCLHLRGHRFLAALLTLLGRRVAGMEIHPGARIGRRFFVDHGFGVVIGETALVGDDVTLYHQVTLGSRGWWDPAERGGRRHPSIGDRASIGVGSSVLGPVRIGDDVHIPAHRLVLEDRPGQDADAAFGAPVVLDGVGR
ncbi:serine O-acetyltransferase [Kitasatospora sp. NPDC088783]|uniref:serine O-acetyltransferase n=1 Tax=Kitasatospora sp. NPDC088783 TaxID=3364077 RepID=UPI0037F95878